MPMLGAHNRAGVTPPLRKPVHRDVEIGSPGYGRLFFVLEGAGQLVWTGGAIRVIMGRDEKTSSGSWYSVSRG